ncbi:hypothetical protein KP509_09G057100 [Ceratopteris richardii]|uniref:RmlD-like substrate binding domain-containing protein n=1 Tax=Ceratopteris richardii TaxID=49495 RepID=A0A8T2U4W5_CERRI|nr:hypothetical protein KP509_09G057100 [Ceratopteris richardii]
MRSSSGWRDMRLPSDSEVWSITEEMEGLIVVVGGSGYLGMHLLQSLSIHFRRLAFTYFSHPPSPALCAAIPHARPFAVDLRSGDGFSSISNEMGPPQVVINCAAVSIPRECEADPVSARSINVPHALISWLSSLSDVDPPLLVQLSTDQVYEGTKSFYKEDDEAKPVNTYGRSKLEAEQLIMETWHNYAILRSSIIYGPEAIVQVPKSLPIQWMMEVLRSGKGADFFMDEFRSPVFVKDIVRMVEVLAKKKIDKEPTMQLLLNAGGPQRLSRAEMAEIVAEVGGFDKSLIRHIRAASVNRGVASPADISMDMSRCISTFGITLTPFRDGVEQTLKLHF